jgi:hypothetical protein
MPDKLVECETHGEISPAFICHHLLSHKKVGWNEPETYEFDQDDEFAGCINAWCDRCEDFVNKIGEWNDESEAFADIRLVCERCAKKLKEFNLA